MRLLFGFDTPRSYDEVRATFEAMASTLTERKVSLQRVEHSEMNDLNGLGPCFVSKWTDGAVTFDESLLNTDGDPHNGYGYSLQLKLTIPSRPSLTLKVGGFGSHPRLRELVFDFDGAGGDWLALRRTLRRELGEAADRCHTPSVASEVLPELAACGELPAALALAKESLAGSQHGELGRQEIVDWVALNDQQAGGAAMRVREAPEVLEGWLELERSGAPGLTESFARLCPSDLNRWRAAGLPPAPWFAHPDWPLERDDSAGGTWKTVHLVAGDVWPNFVNSLSNALTGWSDGTDWRDLRSEWGEGVDGWQWRFSRRARFPEGAELPVVHVTLERVRREPHEWKLGWEALWSLPFKETVTWSWIGGPQTGDVALIVERRVPTHEKGPPQSAGLAFTVVGTSEFRARAEAAVISESHWRWYPVDAAASLKPWHPAGAAFPDAKAALEATVSPERFARGKELLTCRCPQPAAGFCEHRAELLSYSREDRIGETPAAVARNAAWNAAFHSVGEVPNLDLKKKYLGEAFSAHVRASEHVP